VITFAICRSEIVDSFSLTNSNRVQVIEYSN